MDHFQRIYNDEAETYQRLIAAEDVDGNLLPALRAITPLSGKRVLDLGTGTGRLPLLLHESVKSMAGIDRYAAMLQEQQRQQARVGRNWPLVQGDMARLPFGPAGFDVAIAGWAVGHLTAWAAGQWPQAAGQVVQEMTRVTRPEGTLIIIETLGTGRVSPAAPNLALRDYYAWLEAHHGFHRLEIATDYQFQDLAEAVDLTGFFFGSEMAERVRNRHWLRVPEWTGIWWKNRTD